MRITRELLFCGIVGISCVALAPAMSMATVLWNESSSGDLSNSGTAPTAFTLGLGTNSVIGSVGPGDMQDWIALTVPAGDQLGNLFLTSYTSTDAQGFTGVQAGSTFVGSSTSAGAYLGYTHFGTGAANGALAPVDLVGMDLLPLMGNNTVDSLGSQGFTPPLPAGTYTFLIQQLGASTSYQFDYDTTLVPEPAALALLSVAAPLLLRRRRAN